MPDPVMIVSVVSTIIAALNAIGIVLIWRKYLLLAADSAVFAAEVIGAVMVRKDGDGEVKDPVGLLASGLHFFDS